MPLVFWIENAAYAIAAVSALALAMTVLSSGPARASNRLFALFACSEAVWGVSALLMRMSLWQNEGDPQFWLELAAVSLNLMGPTLLLFTTRYVNCRARWLDAAAIAGLAGIAALAIPTFSHQLLLNPRLEASGLAAYDVLPAGYAASLLAMLYLAASAFLFWRGRRQTGEPYLALSGLILLLGFMLGGVLRSYLPYPILSITTTLSVLILGYGIVSRQLLNPLRELTTQLERQVEERTQELKEINQALARQSAEFQAANARLQEASQRAEQRAAELQALQDISLRINTRLDLSELLRLILEQAVKLLGAESGGLYIYDELSSRLVMTVATGYFSEFIGRTLKPGESIAGRVFAERRSMAVDDYSGWSGRATAYAQDAHLKAILAVPLLGKKEVLGVLDIGGGASKRTFDEHDIWLTELFAAQAAVALENVRLFQQTEAALKELEAANRLATRQGWQDYVEQAATTRRAEFRADQVAGTSELCEPLSLPLELRGQAIGRLTLRRPDKRAWSKDEIELIRAIAVQTTLAADNARLVEQTQKALQETQGLFQAARAITAAAQIGQLEALCQELANRFSGLLRAHATRITLVDHDKQQILVRVSSGQASDTQLRTTYAELNSGLGGVVFRTGQPVLSLDADDGIEPEETRQRRKQANIGAMIIAPLVIKGATCGLISTYNQIGQARFTRHDVELVMALSAQAATAIENVRLLEETHRRAERERLIRQITTRMRESPDTEAILRTTVQEIRRALGASHGVVRLGLAADTQEARDER